MQSWRFASLTYPAWQQKTPMASADKTASSSADPLTQAHYQELALAQSRVKPISKAARVAAFNGWTTGVIAALSAPFALFSITGLLMTVGLSVVAYNEFRGRKRLLRLDPSATSLLGWNQIGLLSLVVLYCLWMIYSGLVDPSPVTTIVQANAEVSDVFGSLGDMDELYRRLLLAVYGSVLALTVIFQGLNAYYYFSRRKYVDACLQETPEWALEFIRKQSGG